jgi:large subunit ribosomal protein L6
MGRLGKLPVQVPANVEAQIDGHTIKIKGPKGELVRDFPREVKVEKLENGELMVTKKTNSKEGSARQGTIRSHIVNMLKGVTDGWSKVLEINGAGYRAEARGKDLVLTVGYSHPVIIEGLGGTTFKVEKNLVTVEGPDKEIVGHTAALVRGARKPNVYTGSGIAYKDEVIRRKAGKTAAGAGE